MKTQYLGHSTFIVDLTTTSLIIDPFISGNPLAKNIEVDDIKVDYILLTHAHDDHILDAERIAKNNKATIIGMPELCERYSKEGINCEMMNIGGKLKFDFGQVIMTHALHSSSFSDRTYGGTAAGFIIKAENKTLFHAGDTAITYDFTLYAKLYGPIDTTILPIGDRFTMGVDEAILSAQLLETKKVIASHFNTFPLIEVDLEEAKNKFKDNNIEIVIPNIKDTIEI